MFRADVSWKWVQWKPQCSSALQGVCLQSHARMCGLRCVNVLPFFWSVGDHRIPTKKACTLKTEQKPVILLLLFEHSRIFFKLPEDNSKLLPVTEFFWRLFSYCVVTFQSPLIQELPSSSPSSRFFSTPPFWFLVLVFSLKEGMGVHAYNSGC